MNLSPRQKQIVEQAVLWAMAREFAYLHNPNNMDSTTYKAAGAPTDLYAWLKPSHSTPPVAEARPLNPWNVAYDRESDPRFARKQEH